MGEKNQEKIIESENKFRALVEQTSEMLFFHDTKGQLIDVNKAAEKNTGYTKKELLSMTVFDIDPDAKERKDMEKYWKKLKVYDPPTTFEVRHKRKNGTIYDAEVVISKIVISNKNYILGLARDITEKKKIYDELKESEERYKSLFTNAPDMIFTLDKKGKIISLNKTPQGLKLKDAIGDSIYNYVPETNRDNLKNIIKQVFETGKKTNFEIMANSDDRTIGYWSTSAAPIKVGNEVKEAIFITRDITKQKKSEMKLLKINTAVKQSPSVIVITDLKGNITYVNPRFTKLTGYTKNEAIGKNPNILKSGEIKDKIYKELWEKIKSGKKWFGEFHNKRKDGSLYWEQASISPIVDSAGKIINFLKVAEDITERKQAEKELIETLNATTEGIWTWDFKTDKLFFSDRYYTMLGYKPQEFKANYENWLNLIHPEDRKKALKVAEKYLKTKPDFYENEFRLKTKNGEYRWIHAKAKVVERDRKGNAIKMIGNHEDITEKKLAEIELKRNEEIFKTIVETAPSLLLISDKKGNVTYISPNSKEFTGYTPEEFIGTLKWWVHPDDTDKAKLIFKKAFKNYTSGKNFEYKAVKKKGEIWYASSSWEPLYDQNKNFHGTIMQTIDITERKKREQELKKGLMRYNLDDGRLYLEIEKTHTKSIQALNDLIKAGYQGHIISRTSREQFKEDIKEITTYKWLTDKNIKDTIRPNINDILKEVEKTQENQVFLIDRMDYILSKIGFSKTLDLIQKLTEAAYLKDHIIIISLDPDILTKQQLTHITKEANEIEPKSKIQIDEDLKEILEYIYQKNLNSIKPSYSEIGEKLDISKPTTRNKVRRLIKNGYLTEKTKGREKILEITDKTRNIFI